MDKKDFLERTSMGGLVDEDRQLLLDTIEQGFSIEDAALMQLQFRTSLLFSMHHKMIAESIGALVKMKKWTSLMEIFRSLPGDIIDASNGTDAEKVWKEWATEMSAFMGMSQKNRKMALKLVIENSEGDDGGVR